MLFLLLTILLSHACDQQTLEAITKPEPKPPVAVNRSLTSDIYLAHQKKVLAKVSKEDAKAASLLLYAQLQDAAKLARRGEWTKAHERLENNLPFEKSGYKMTPLLERERIVLDVKLDPNKPPPLEYIHDLAGRKSNVNGKGEINIAELLIRKPGGNRVSIWLQPNDDTPHIVAIRAALVRLQMEEQIHVLQMLKEHAGGGAYLEIGRFAPSDLNEILALKKQPERINPDLEADAYAHLLRLLGSENMPEYYSNFYPAARGIVNRVLGR